MLANSDIGLHPSAAISRDSFSDEVLWNSFKTGNELALSVLYRKYVQQLYAYGMHTAHSREMVTDCLQELFLRLWKNRDTIGNVKEARPYLFKSFRRLLINEITTRRKEYAPMPDENAFGFIPSIESTLIDAESREEMLQQLRNCVQSLTRGQREVIYLKFFNDLSYQEISDITEIQVDSVYNLVSKTIDLLRKKLQVTKPLVPVR
jgi:RNA polymerase sigma factor (sigma-70 family)